MSDEETRDAGLGMEFFTRRMFYGLPRPVRAKLVAAWKGHGPREQGEGHVVDIFEQYVGAIEDVLWAAGERKLCKVVLGAAAEARVEREKLVADLREMAKRASIPTAAGSEWERTVLRNYATSDDVHGLTKASYRPGDREVPEGEAVFEADPRTAGVANTLPGDIVQPIGGKPMVVGKDGRVVSLAEYAAETLGRPSSAAGHRDR